MKILIKILFILFAVLIFSSCQSNREQGDSASESKTETKTKDLQTVKLEIKGMTCEIGCAKLIQSKLYKTDGVSFAKISFADSSGVVKYDASRLNENDLRAVVESAGGGDLYRVMQVSQVEEAETEEKTPAVSQ